MLLRFVVPYPTMEMPTWKVVLLTLLDLETTVAHLRLTLLNPTLLHTHGDAKLTTPLCLFFRKARLI